MKQLWNERYQQKEFAYGTEPNAFVKEQLPNIPLGTALFPAEGEGRNAVYAATLGWNVSAFDQSEEGKKKALLLAEQNNVSIDYEVNELENISYPKNSFDALVLIYAHFQEENRADYHKKLTGFLRSGGVLILEGFSKKNLEYVALNPTVGGPKDIRMLFSIDDLKSDFDNFDIISLKEEEVYLNEGLYHNGKGSVIRILARKN